MIELIGFTGKAQVGKDTAADVLVKEYGFTKVAFADPLKEALIALDPLVSTWEDVEGETHREHLSDLIEEWTREPPKAPLWEYLKNYSEVRRSLQRLGTEVGRQYLSAQLLYGQSIWTELMGSRLDQMVHGDGTERIVISDIRFPDEANLVNSFSTMGHTRIYRIVRPGFDGLTGGAAAHVSEAHDFEVDGTLRNDRTLEDFQRKVGFCYEMGEI